MKPKLVRITTVPLSLKYLLGGQLDYVSDHFEVTAISSGTNEEISALFDNPNIGVKSISMTRKITPIKDCIALYKLYRYFRQTGPEIVHTHTPKAGLLGMIAAYLAKIPIRLHTVAGMPLMEAHGLKKRILQLVEKITYASATKIYPNSYGLKNYILENDFTDPKKIEVLGQGSSNGIDTIFFDINHPDLAQSSKSLKLELGFESDDFVFVFVGRLVSDKGINELVRAFEDMNHHKKVRLLLVGPLEPDLDPLDQETLASIKSNSRIQAVGFQQDVRPYFAISDVLVFPSYREGFPNVVMQAGSMGLPSIVSNINGCNEIISDGINGLVIPVKKSKAIQQSMTRLLEDVQLLEKLRSKAREIIKDRYDQKSHWKTILEEYYHQLAISK